MTESTSTAVVERPGHQPELKRVMGPKLLLLFIVGDILGTGIYALTGQVAKQVGGMVWLPFLVAFVVALMTAFSYLELVTKYPKAAGAALSAKRGKTSTSKLKGASRGMYKSMSEKQLDEFASTKRKGKPEHVSKSRTKKSSSRSTARKSPTRKSTARKTSSRRKSSR